jgi:GH15 family glucan-1,4-alpha-glucosidase
MRPTGGIVAAPTTSLPEKLGGQRNWDYRFCWLRDATFTLLALMNSGYTAEAAAWHNWLLRAAAGAPANMQIMYGIMGQRRLLEWEASWLPGYEGAKPVRVGNAAHAQLQLDVYGELIDAFHQSRMVELKLDDGTWAWSARCWSIWRGYGTSRTTASGSAAAPPGIRIFEGDDVGGVRSRHQERRAVRLQGAARALAEPARYICREVCEKGFDATQNTFVESYGSQVLDASILLLPAVVSCPLGSRGSRHHRAHRKHLMRDGFVLRHDPREVSDEQQPIEGAFLACSLWLADAYVLAGEIDKAQALFDRVVAVANDLGLLAEEYRFRRGRQTGNFPQALTHIALINTAHNLSVARKPADKPACSGRRSDR